MIMFTLRAPVNAPSLSYGEVLKKIDKKEITSIRLSPGTPVSVYETKDGEVGKASIVANDFFIEKASSNDVDLIISEPGTRSVNILDFFPIVIALLLTYMIINRPDGSSSPMNPFGNTFNFETTQDTGVTFSDVAGIDEAKEELVEIVEFLKNPERFSDAGATIPKGCLLSGEPGTGKTLLAKAIAGEANVPFIATSASQFVELFVGLGASRIRSLFKQAREVKPCIIFIDEIDAIGKARGGNIAVSGGNDEREQTLNQILLEMDGFKDNEGIIVLGSTNRPEILDKALMRPGRFDRKIAVELPDMAGRRRILGVHTKNKQLDCGVQLKDIARVTTGASGAELANIMNEAAIMAARDGRKIIQQVDVDEAIDKTLLGLKRKVKVTEETKKLVAYHEAGHALIGAIVDGPETIQKITIIPRGRTGGVTMFFPPESQDNNLVTKEYLRNRILIALGGTVAEEHIYGKDKITIGASGDIQQITQIATTMIQNYGFGKSKLIRGDDTIKGEVEELVDEAYKEARSMIVAYNDKLELIANALVEKETLTNEEFKNVIKM